VNARTNRWVIAAAIAALILGLLNTILQPTGKEMWTNPRCLLAIHPTVCIHHRFNSLSALSSYSVPDFLALSKS
jgi:hypothetical protein